MISLPNSINKYNSPLEYGMGLIFGNENDKITYEPECFARIILLEKIILNTNISDNNLKQSIHISLLSYKDISKPYTHNFGFGINNSGWYPELDNLYNSVIGAYINYNLEYESMIFHLGLAKNKNTHQEKNLLLFGIEHLTEFGNVVLEWDGTRANFGFSVDLIKNKAYIGITPNQNKTSLKNQLLTIGYSWKSDHLFEIDKKSNKYKSQKRNSRKSLSIGAASIQKTLERMERGMDLYTRGYYPLAKLELEKVIEIFPTPTAYSRLGSIHYKLKEYDKALENWNKALQLNPSDNKVKEMIDFVNKLKK
ncbi:MAG: tetratricopeptide repeat protein [bacterium]